MQWLKKMFWIFLLLPLLAVPIPYMKGGMMVLSRWNPCFLQLPPTVVLAYLAWMGGKKQ